MYRSRHRTLHLFRRGPSAQLRLVVYLGLALGLTVVDAHWRVLEPVRQVLSITLYPLQRVTMLPRDVAAGIHDWANAAANIRVEQESLQNQRIALAQLTTRAAQLSAENQQLRRLLSVSERIHQTPVAVQVLREPANAFGRTIIFSKGSTHGIAPGMPVMDEGGVVGQIVRVTPYTSEAALVTDERIAIPAQIVRNGLRVIAFGGGVDNRMEVRHLTVDTDVQPGDMLITSGVGEVFPAGLPVAQITAVSHEAATGFIVASAEPLAHPRRYRHFLVLLTNIDAGEKNATTADESARATTTAGQTSP